MLDVELAWNLGDVHAGVEQEDQLEAVEELVSELVLFLLLALECLARSRSQRRVEQADFLQKVRVWLVAPVLVRKVLVQTDVVFQNHLVDRLELDELGGKLLEVAEVVLEEADVAELGGHALANADVRNRRLVVELGIVHREVDGLLVVQDRYQLSPRQVGLVVLDHQLVPLLCLDVRNFDAVAVDSGRTVAAGQHPVNHLIVWVEVAFESAVPLSEAVEEHREVVGIEGLDDFPLGSVGVRGTARSRKDEALEADCEGVSLLKRPRGLRSGYALSAWLGRRPRLRIRGAPCEPAAVVLEAALAP